MQTRLTGYDDAFEIQMYQWGVHSDPRLHSFHLILSPSLGRRVWRARLDYIVIPDA